MHYLSTHISKCVNLFGEIRKAICPVEKYIEKNEFDFEKILKRRFSHKYISNLFI